MTRHPLPQNQAGRESSVYRILLLVRQNLTLLPYTATASSRHLHLFPLTGKQACFSLRGQLLQEINWFKPDYGSWFVSDMVLQGMSSCEDLLCQASSEVAPIAVGAFFIRQNYRNDDKVLFLTPL